MSCVAVGVLGHPKYSHRFHVGLQTKQCQLTPGAAQEKDDHALEAMLGFPLFTDGEERLGWLMNLNAVRLCSLEF